MEFNSVQFQPEERPLAEAALEVDEAIVFEPDLQLRILSPDGSELHHAADFSAAGHAVAWLPRGIYHFTCRLHGADLPPGPCRVEWHASLRHAGERRTVARTAIQSDLPNRTPEGGLSAPAWSLSSEPGTAAVEELPWNHGHEDWFFRHFDHAALVVTDYLLAGHEALHGRILDVGCGDGIIDLGIFWRRQPVELVGIDPFRGYERLPRVLEENHLPADLLDDPRLRFLPEDANSIPFPENHFDVVVSWGSLEHIAGGYDGVLREIRRVLKPGGLLFVHPGLFYGALGNHLGEFFDDPFIHLKLPEDELREAVLSTEPERMDRAGHVAAPQEYWQWYTELNPITAGGFERELRALDFEPWRVAIRTSDLIEYTPELQRYPMQDLATAELYLSAFNRKGQARSR